MLADSPRRSNCSRRSFELALVTHRELFSASCGSTEIGVVASRDARLSVIEHSNDVFMGISRPQRAPVNTREGCLLEFEGQTILEQEGLRRYTSLCIALTSECIKYALGNVGINCLCNHPPDMKRSKISRPIATVNRVHYPCIYHVFLAHTCAATPTRPRTLFNPSWPTTPSQLLNAQSSNNNIHTTQSLREEDDQASEPSTRPIIPSSPADIYTNLPITLRAVHIRS